MIAYKAFDPGLICRGYQFQMGQNITEKANCASNGFHSAENPLDCLTYYHNIDKSEFCLVEVGGDLNEDGNDTKIASTQLEIIQRITPEELFLHGLAFMVDHPFRDTSSQVCDNKGVASGGYAVVRGKNPMARGELGDILALAQEEPKSKKICKVSLVSVDGEEILPDTWYGINLMECEENK